MYKNYSHLAKFESENIDYRIELKDNNTNILVIAPHGGKIEFYTSEITRALATNINSSYYIFEGCKESKNFSLHLTSTIFDEPRAMELINKSNYIITIHGFASDKEIIHLGGKSKNLKNIFYSSLYKLGYKVVRNSEKYPGLDRKNICNKGKNGKGLQIEFSSAIRKTLNLKEFGMQFGKIIHSNNCFSE